jgi:hypothetical protein
MPSSVYRTVKITNWFPPDDPLAAKIARLCILRNDLLMAYRGIDAANIAELDAHSPQVRRMYFIRALLLAQIETYSAMQTLLPNPNFKTLLAKQTEQIKAEFKQAASVMGKAQPILIDARNDIAGHVLERAVQGALQRIRTERPDASGLLEAGPTVMLTQYRFADELTAEILMAGLSEEERQNVESKLFAAIGDLVGPFARLIEHCFVMYSVDRGLL